MSAPKAMWSDGDGPGPGEISAKTCRMWSEEEPSDPGEEKPTEPKGCVDRLRENAKHARQAKQARKLAREGRQPRKHEEEANGAMDKNSREVVRKFFAQGWRASGRETARALAVEPRWLGRAALVAAAWTLDEEMDAFMRLMADVEEGWRTGKLEPGNFVWARMYDESPFTLRTHSLSPEGHAEGESSTAKVVGSRLQFAFTVFVPGVRGEAGLTAPDVECHVVRGHLSSRLTSCTSMHAPKMLAAIRSTMALPDDARRKVEQLFPRAAWRSTATSTRRTTPRSGRSAATTTDGPPPSGGAVSTGPGLRRHAPLPWTRPWSHCYSTWASSFSELRAPGRVSINGCRIGLSLTW